MKKSLFVSGPHGSGKTTLIHRLLDDKRFLENDFDINFLKDFSGFSELGCFEKCLIRLYHRMYLTKYSQYLANVHEGKVIVTSRGLYDSIAYTESYLKMGWITVEQANQIRFIIGHPENKPDTIILNPKFEVIRERLNLRIQKGVRENRDKVFSYEDTEDFLKVLHESFREMRDWENVLYLEDNNEKDIAEIHKWVQVNGE